MLDLSVATYTLVFLVLVTPICLWVIFTDLKYMKIRNGAVIALVLVFAVAGVLMMPLDIWAWRWVNLLVVLAIGFVLNLAANFGAGDAKFAAAAAPFFSPALDHVQVAVFLLCAFLLVTFAAHRVLRKIPAVVSRTPDWVSWKRADFPMGLALVGTLWSYLGLITLIG